MLVGFWGVTIMPCPCLWECTDEYITAGNCVLLSMMCFSLYLWNEMWFTIKPDLNSGEKWFWLYGVYLDMYFHWWWVIILWPVLSMYSVTCSSADFCVCVCVCIGIEWWGQEETVWHIRLSWIWCWTNRRSPAAVLEWRWHQRGPWGTLPKDLWGIFWRSGIWRHLWRQHHLWSSTGGQTITVGSMYYTYWCTVLIRGNCECIL